MEKTVMATYDGTALKTHDPLDLPINRPIRIFLQTKEDENGNGQRDRDDELPPQNTLGLLRLLESWREDSDDAEEQKETWEYLKRVLDEDRLSDRRLFP